MYRNVLQFGLAICVLTTCIGCQGMCNVYQPLDHHHGWDPVLGSCDTCGSCGGACEGHTPCSYTNHMLTCASGCGEVYWGEWISDPPDPCDPCDRCGNFVGPRPCPPTFWQSLSYGWCNLWGQRTACTSCDVCGTEVADYGMPVADYGMPVTEGVRVPTAPPDTGDQAPEEAAGDDRLDPVPDRQATLNSRPRPLWRARSISQSSRRRMYQ